LTLAQNIRLQMAKIRFTIKALQDGEMPFMSASIFRGMWGREIRNIACQIPKIECEHCPLITNCAYGSIYEPISEVFAPEYIHQMKQLPPPIIIDAPHFPEGTWKKGESKTVTITFFGDSFRHAHYFVKTLYTIGEQYGVGPKRVLFDVLSIEQLFPNGRKVTLTIDDFLDDNVFSQPWVWGKLEEDISRILIQIRTPLRIQSKGTVIQDISEEDFIKAIIRRIDFLTSLYGTTTETLNWETNLNDLRITNKSIEWVTMERYSGKQKKIMNFGGIVGSFELIGSSIGLFFPYLKCASNVHIGKQTIFGFGAFEIWKPI
jgi:hypothetical protein